MKDSYHISFTSHNEVIFRDREDLTMFVNMLAIHSYKDDVGIVADSEMSTHIHLHAVAEEPYRFAGRVKMSYYRWFNRKYCRKGSIGEEGSFVLPLNGLYHKMVATSYILRNGMHHGACSNAFGYEWCSARDMFADDLPFLVKPAAFTSRSDIEHRLPKDVVFPDNWRMNEDGMFLRQDFMEIPIAESLYGTPRNYLYQMNRITDEKIIEEQIKDNTGAPITLSDIERAQGADLTAMLKNESGRMFSRNKLQDLDVCHLIDDEILPQLGVPSVYLLTDSHRQRIAQHLRYDRHLPPSQIARCLPGVG